jgi:hypothetical protein
MKLFVNSENDYVMKRNKSQKTKWLHLRISQEEYDKLQIDLKGTTCRKLSEYVRDIVFNRPITVFFRSKSADEFLQVAVGLKNELNAAGKNFNQAVKRLHEVYHQSTWRDDLNFFEATQFSLNQKINEIKQVLVKMYERFQKETPPKEGS